MCNIYIHTYIYISEMNHVQTSSRQGSKEQQDDALQRKIEARRQHLAINVSGKSNGTPSFKFRIPPEPNGGFHKWWYPLVISQFAIEHGPVEIVDLPTNSMVDLSTAVSFHKWWYPLVI